jgi:uncharacterized Zn finger protein
MNNPKTYAVNRSPKRNTSRNHAANTRGNTFSSARVSQKKNPSITLSGNPPDAQETWWSQKFIQSLESFKFGNRLIRGREYAKDGRVQKITLAPGMVTALVSGSRKTPYFVSITLDPFPDVAWKKISFDFAKRAILVIQMLQDRMPESVEEVFRASRLSLFPAQLDQLHSDCDCPDDANPCKHIAATYYVLARHFDLDPFLIFTLRGRTKSQILEFLQYFWKKGRPKTDLKPMVVPRKSFSKRDVNGFWLSPPDEKIQSRLDPMSSSIPDTLIKKLGPAPVNLDDVNFEQILSETYQYTSATIREWVEKKRK